MARIAVDASGGDQAPRVPVAGAIEALKTLPPSSEVVLVGVKAEIEAELAQYGVDTGQVSVVEAPQKIGMDEQPLSSIRNKRKSSIVVGLELHKAQEVDAFISAGNTGAVMAASTLLLRLHEGIERPAIGTVLPTIAHPVLMLDAGANVDCSAKELLGFAHLGSVFARDVFDCVQPGVGLLNIGEEARKGNVAAKEAHALLTDDPKIHFIGNVEGSDILTGHADVIVCDGFVGNIVLKFYESAGRTFSGLLKQELEPSILERKGMQRAFEFLDPSQYGGAPLLGVRGIPIICHGSASPFAISQAVHVAIRAVDNHLSQHIHDEFVADEVTT